MTSAVFQGTISAGQRQAYQFPCFPPPAPQNNFYASLMVTDAKAKSHLKMSVVYTPPPPAGLSPRTTNCSAIPNTVLAVSECDMLGLSFSFPMPTLTNILIIILEADSTLQGTVSYVIGAVLTPA